jgi:hypothetical protein
MRLHRVDHEHIDKSQVFVEVNSVSWRSPQHISIEDLQKGVKYHIQKDIDNVTLKMDPSTHKLEVDFSHLETPSVHSSSYTDQNIFYNQPPKDCSTLSGMHVVTDGNFLYVWVGNRWKRSILSEW